MTTLRSRSSGTAVRVVRPMNRHGTMTVEVEETRQTRHVVDYADESLKSTLATLPEGTSIPVAMRRLNCRSNAWLATGLGGRSASDAAASTGD